MLQSSRNMRLFPRLESGLPDHIIADPVHITSISIQQMAAELGIAESSIIRFCKILGCTGFSEMKLLLAKYSPKSGSNNIRRFV